MKLVVTIPAQNEAPTIGRVVEEVPRAIPGVDEVQVIVIDDGSTDGTPDLAREAGATVVTIGGRPGLGPIWRLGMERAMRAGADLIVNIDGDGQFHSADVARIIQPLLLEQCDFVTCTRFAGGGPSGYMPPVKRWGNRVVTWMTNRVCGTNFTDVSCGFRAYNRESAYRLAQFGRWTYTEECIIYMVNRGIRTREMHFDVRGEREFGHSRVAGNVLYFASHLVHILIRAVRDGRPLKFFGLLSMLLAIPGAALLVFTLSWYLVHGTLVPFTQFLALGGMGIVGGVLVFVLALLADMVSRHREIHEELLYLARHHYFGSGATRQWDEPAPVPPDLALVGFFND